MTVMLIVLDRNILWIEFLMLNSNAKYYLTVCKQMINILKNYEYELGILETNYLCLNKWDLATCLKIKLTKNVPPYLFFLTCYLHTHTHTHLHLYIYIYIYIYIRTIIRTGKLFKSEHLNFPGKELNVTDITEQ